MADQRASLCPDCNVRIATGNCRHTMFDHERSQVIMSRAAYDEQQEKLTQISEQLRGLEVSMLDRISVAVEVARDEAYAEARSDLIDALGTDQLTDWVLVSVYERAHPEQPSFADAPPHVQEAWREATRHYLDSAARMLPRINPD